MTSRLSGKLPICASGLQTGLMRAGIGCQKPRWQDQAAADYADLFRYPGSYQAFEVPAFDERSKPDIKSLRDKFIIENLR